MGNALNNLAITSTDRALTSAMGAMFDTLQSKIANGGRDRNCKFYYNAGAGGSILQVAVKTVVKGAVSSAHDMAMDQINSLFEKKGKKIKPDTRWTSPIEKKHTLENDKYGKIVINGVTLYAIDEWGGRTNEGLMLAAKLDEDNYITYYQKFYRYKTIKKEKKLPFKKDSIYVYEESDPDVIENIVTTNTLFWYDTTALISIDSDKNVVISKIQGRDYSRKELVSNGDIRFTVSGQITSGKPDIYPAEEVQKFIKMMQYKGIIKVNNQILDQFGIDHILITDWSMPPKRGYKSTQQYSFSAIGLQPESETTIQSDTVEIIQQRKVDKEKDDKTKWKKMLDNKLAGLTSMAKDVLSQGAGLASGMLENGL